MPWAATLAGSAAAALLAVAGLAAVRRPRRRRGRTVPALGALRGVAVPASCLLGLALLGALQLVPLPDALRTALAPDAAQATAAARAALDEPSSGAGRADSAAADAGSAGEPGALPLSLAPRATARTALLFASLAAALAAAALACRKRPARRVLAGALVATGLLQVIFGARRWFAGATELWGVALPGSPGRLRGSFVNPDHLALYLELTLAVTFAWGFWAVRRARHEPEVDRRILLVAPPLLAWPTLFAGLAFTGSRAGLVAAALAALVQGLAAAWATPGRAGRVFGLAGVGAVALGLGVVAVLGAREGLGRFVDPGEAGWNERALVYRSLAELVGRSPWLGTGLGSFRDVFPLVQPAELGAVTWRHAHSDWLELLVTGGVVACLLVAVGLVFLLRRLALRLRESRRSEDRAAVVAALGALAAAGLHELVDFGLTMPANAFTLAVVCGAAASVGRFGRPSAPVLEVLERDS